MTNNVIPWPIKDEPVGEFPIVFCGGPLECGRCDIITIPQTWVVQDGPLMVCAGCATQDPTLSIWQKLCDVYDQIDNLMITAASPAEKKIFAQMIAGEAEHFAEWRETTPSSYIEEPPC